VLRACQVCLLKTNVFATPSPLRMLALLSAYASC
jgi:hypothetical protein